MTERETTKAEIERHLWEAIDLMAATLEQPDPRIWDRLLVYRPKAAPSPAGDWRRKDWIGCTCPRCQQRPPSSGDAND